MMSPLCILEVGPSGLLARNAAVLNGRSCLGISGRHLLPGFYLSGQSFLMNGPIMESGRIKVGSIRPYQGMNFPVELDLIKYLEIPQRIV
jgi:hypothetical protein